MASAAEQLHLVRGEAAFIGHEDGRLAATGTGRVAIGVVPG